MAKKVKKPKFMAAEKRAFATGEGVSEGGATVIDGGSLPPEEPERAAKLSIALDWQETEPGSGIWEATTDDGGRYTCTEIGGTWRAGYSLTRLVPLWPEQANLEGAQLLCEQHYAGRGLEWHKGVQCWLADDGDELHRYACELDDDGEQWLATDQGTDTEIGAGTLDEAQALCQIHRGKRLLERSAGEMDAWPETMRQLGAGGPPKPNNVPVPKRERGSWTIPLPLTEAEKARAKEEFDDIWDEIRLHQGDIAASAERHAAVKKRKTEQIGELEEQLDELRNRMPEREVDCYREYSKDPDDGEWWVHYISLDDEAFPLHERRLEQWEQRQLFGEGDPPADKPPEEERAGPTAEAKANAPEPGAETDEVRHPGNEQAPLDWKRVRLDGQPAYRAEVPGGEYRVERQATSGPGKGLLVAFWAPTDGERVELPGQHDKVADAKAEALQHWQSRLQWPGDPASGLLVSKCGKYQLSRHMVGAAAGQKWRALHLSGQDQDPVDLGDHLLPEAQAACQAHADAGRAGR